MKKNTKFVLLMTISLLYYFFNKYCALCLACTLVSTLSNHCTHTCSAKRNFRIASHQLEMFDFKILVDFALDKIREGP